MGKILPITLFLLLTLQVSGKDLPRCLPAPLEVQGYKGPKLLLESNKLHVLYKRGDDVRELLIFKLQKRGGPVVRVTYKGPLVEGSPPLPFLHLLQEVQQFLRDEGHRKRCLELLSVKEEEVTTSYLKRNGGSYVSAVLTWLFLLFIGVFSWYVSKNSSPLERDVNKQGKLPLILLGGLIIFYAIDGILYLPYDVRDLWYIQAIEFDSVHPLEFLHPLYVPVMNAFKVVFDLFYHGRFVYVLETLNLFAGLSGLILLFLLAKRFSGPWEALALVFLWSLTLPVKEALHRPVPYAWGMLTVAGAWYVVLSSKPLWHTVLLAGLLTGTAAGFHLSVTVLPVAFLGYYYLFHKKELKRHASWFLGGFLLALGSSFLLLYLNHYPEASIIFTFPFSSKRISLYQQVPGSSILDNSLDNLIVVFARENLPYLVALGIGLVGGLFVFKSQWGALKRLLAAALLQIFTLGTFFGLFNVYNGFAFVSFLLGIPLCAAILSRFYRKIPVMVILPLYILGFLIVLPAIHDDLAASGKNSPVFREYRLLDEILGNNGYLIVPGIVSFEVWYFTQIHFIEVLPPNIHHTLPPERVKKVSMRDLLPLAEKLLRSHAKLLYTEGYTGEIEGFDPAGVESSKQVFINPCGFKAKQRRDCVEPVTKTLRRDFLLKEAFKGPLGDTYYHVVQRE